MFSASMERIQFSGQDSNVYFLKLGFPLTGTTPISADCDIDQSKTNANSALQTEYELASQALMSFQENEIKVTEYTLAPHDECIYRMSFQNTDESRFVGYENPCTSTLGTPTGTVTDYFLPDSSTYNKLELNFRYSNAGAHNFSCLYSVQDINVPTDSECMIKA